MNVVFFLLGDFLASEFYVPLFGNTLFHIHRLPMKMKQSVPKRRYIKFRPLEISKREYKTNTPSQTFRIGDKFGTLISRAFNGSKFGAEATRKIVIILCQVFLLKLLTSKL